MKRTSHIPPIENAQTIIQDAMQFLLERNERRFEKLLRAQLLQEGCNYPLALARPRFYQLMLSGLLVQADSGTQEKLKNMLTASPPSSGEPLPHEVFYNALCLLTNKLDHAGKVMALEVINSLQTITQESQLDPAMFQENLQQFQARIQTTMNQLWSASHLTLSAPPPFDLVLRRLYMAWMAALLSKMNVKNIFEQEFGSIPDALQAMQQDHHVFCRFMAFCQERTPYFRYLTTQTFWRTLETMRTEQLTDQRLKS
ncbi:hypothetical protein U27_01614 [Candidatus Vecturithrix granuli]|uniref:Uncharacterized protein n=1 Tax=Vecturithrix granuli TaxID=1499967 RepID=A0A0S6W587_VECG1|nr:hypothetical protein U27_01614 [Candidatus Vecturithrix granuli]